MVLKAILAHIVVTYDVKLPGDSRAIPTPMWVSASLVPNHKADVLFRKRGSSVSSEAMTSKRSEH